MLRNVRLASKGSDIDFLRDVFSRRFVACSEDSVRMVWTIRRSADPSSLIMQSQHSLAVCISFGETRAGVLKLMVIILFARSNNASTTLNLARLCVVVCSQKKKYIYAHTGYPT